MALDHESVEAMVTSNDSGAVDVDGITGEPVQVDSESTETPAEDTPAAGEAGEDGFQLEIDGQTYSEEEVRKAFKAVEDNPGLVTKYQQSQQELNILRGLVDTSRATGTPASPSQPATPHTTQADDFSGEQFAELLLEKPDEAMSKLLTFIDERVTGSISDTQARNDFLSKNADFETVVASPEFESFMQDKAGYGDVNGYFAYKAHQAQNALEDAKKNGFKEGEETTIKHLKAKGGIRVLRGAGASTPTAPVKDLKAMPHGEFLNAATEHLKRMRNANN